MFVCRTVRFYWCCHCCFIEEDIKDAWDAESEEEKEEKEEEVKKEEPVQVQAKEPEATTKVGLIQWTIIII